MEVEKNKYMFSFSRCDCPSGGEFEGGQKLIILCLINLLAVGPVPVSTIKNSLKPCITEMRNMKYNVCAR